MAYRDISRGVRLAADHAKYMAWLNKDTAARQAAFQAVNNPADTVKIQREAGYIVPFGSEGSLVYLPARLLRATQPGRGGATAIILRGLIDEYTFTTENIETLTNPNVVDGVKFKPAKLTLIQRVQTATTKEASRITERRYYRHENDSVTAGFGKKLLADTYSSVTTAIRAKSAFGSFFEGATNVFNKFRFVPEKF